MKTEFEFVSGAVFVSRVVCVCNIKTFQPFYILFFCQGFDIQV